MEKFNKELLFMLSIILLSSCVVLPKTLNNNSIIVVAHFKWIGKIGSKTISEGAAKPILRNIETGKLYKPDYKKKSYTYFYKLPKGTYVIEEIVLDAGQISAYMKTADKTNKLEINANSGVFFIGGIDIIDYQFRFEYKIHDNEENQRDLEIIKHHLAEKTSLSENIEIKMIENVFLKERW